MIDEKYYSKNRLWQGIPSIAVSTGGRIFIAYYSGMENEMVGNYVILTYSDDGTTYHLYKIIKPKENKRVFDPALYIGKQGELYLYYAESTGCLYDSVAGVYESVCYEPDCELPVFEKATRICDGIMMNKPTADRKGRLLLPVSLWQFGDFSDKISVLPGSYVIDRKTSKKVGRADIGSYNADEHMIIERIDGSLWMLIRTSYGIGESFSYDQGKTWSVGQKSHIDGPVSRFYIRRLDSGRILLINHYNFTNRNNLYAMLSDDDGITFPHKLLIDERDNVSYPDADIRNNKIYMIHDRERHGVGEILLSCFTEEDILSGTLGKESYVNRVTDHLEST